jgi:hypothetical protein
MNVVSLITCKVTGLSYVSVTKHGERNPGLGADPLRYGHGPRFIKVVKRHGRQAFIIRILGCGYRTRKALHLAERRFIKKHNTVWPNGYNITSGGFGPDFGPAFRKVTGKANRRTAKNPKWRAAVRAGNQRAKNSLWSRHHRVAMQSRDPAWIRRRSKNRRWLASVRRRSKSPRWHAAMRRIRKDPKWAAALRKRNLHQAENGKWLASVRRVHKSARYLATIRAANRRLHKNPAWLAAKQAAVLRRSLNPGLPTVKSLRDKHRCTWREAGIMQRKLAVVKTF